MGRMGMQIAPARMIPEVGQASSAGHLRVLATAELKVEAEA